MKHKLKKILLLYIISGTLFVSCSLEEDYATKKRYEEKMKWNIFLMILNSKKARRANPGNGTCPSLSNLSSFISSKDSR